MHSSEILNFWFKETEPVCWFKKDPQFDEIIWLRFGPIHQAASRGECFRWRDTIDGRLAEIIILDQFSRNIFRNDARAFAYDNMALVLAQEAILINQAQLLPPKMRAFVYMPLMHSESLVIHAEAIRLFSEPGLEENLAYEIKHHEILQRFGRYPHRNAVLGRKSTPEEIEFLKEPGSSF